jgi:hypothetical protein
LNISSIFHTRDRDMPMGRRENLFVPIGLLNPGEAQPARRGRREIRQNPFIESDIL